MKRFIALGLVFAILAVGFTAFADPIHVGGGSFTESTLSPIHVGGGSFTSALAVVPAWAEANGLRAKLVEAPTIQLMPIHVGGGS